MGHVTTVGVDIVGGRDAVLDTREFAAGLAAIAGVGGDPIAGLRGETEAGVHDLAG